MGGSDKLHYLLGTAFLLLALPSCSKQAPPSAVSSLECSAALSFVTDTFEEIRKAPQQDPTGLQFDEAKAEYVDPNSVGLDDIPPDGWFDARGKDIHLPKELISQAIKSPPSNAVTCPTVRKYLTDHKVTVAPDLSLENRYKYAPGWIYRFSRPFVAQDGRHAFITYEASRVIGLGGGTTAHYLERSNSGEWVTVASASMGIS